MITFLISYQKFVVTPYLNCLVESQHMFLCRINNTPSYLFVILQAHFDTSAENQLVKILRRN